MSEPFRHALQELVAQGVPQRVVDLLEAVQIQEEHGQGAFLAPGGVQGGLEPLREEQPVGKPGQAVEVGQLSDLIFVALALRDVLHRPRHAHRPPRLVQEDLRLLVEVAGGAVGVEDLEVDAVGPPFAEGLPPGHGQGLLVLGVHQVLKALRIRGIGVPADAEGAVDFLGPPELAGFQVPLPVPQPGDPVGGRQPRLALAQLVQGPLGAEHVADAVAEDDPVDRLDGEIRGPGVVGLVDRFDVVETGEHHDGGQVPARQSPDGGAGLVAVHFGHQDVQEDQLRPVQGEGLHRLHAVLGFHDDEVRRPRAPGGGASGSSRRRRPAG